MDDIVQTYPYNNLRAAPLREVDERAEEAEKGLLNPITFAVFRAGAPAREIGRFTFAPMPGCCGVVVSTDSWLDPKVRGQVSQRFHALKAQAARALGYSMMIATTETSNFPEVIGASKAHWKLGQAFTNRRTTHQLTIMTKRI